MPFVTPGDFSNYFKFAIGAKRNLSPSGFNSLKNKILEIGSVIVTCIGSDMGKVVVCTEKCITNQQMNSILVYDLRYSDYLYYYLKSISSELKSMAVGGSTMPMLNKSDFEIIKIYKPTDELLLNFYNIIKPINNSIINYSKMSIASKEMKDLLLSKLATKEN